MTEEQIQKALFGLHRTRVSAICKEIEETL